MPKRVIDGDALWTSNTLDKVPEKYRGEYSWILPLSQVNGCFECSPRLVWRTCYAGVRPDWTVADVTAMLDEFEKAKMLFRFEYDGNPYGFFPGIQKEGRLPKPSDRLKSAKVWQSGMVPGQVLAEFLGLSLEQVKEEYGILLATYSRISRPQVMVEGNADDAVLGNADDEVSDKAKVKASVLADGSFAALASEARPPSISTSSALSENTAPNS